MSRQRVLFLGSFILMAAISGAPKFSSAQDTISLSQKGDFRWLNAHRDSEAWAQVRAAFRQELEPDDPAKTAPVVAERYKYVSRIGLFKNLAVVVIGQRETKESKYGDYFLAYNFD